LLQGLSLISSLEKNTNAEISWTVLALDSFTAKTMNSLDFRNLEVISFEDFGDFELKKLRGIRSWREICWTSAACLLSYSLSRSESADFVGYVDADCYFFGDIEQMLKEIPGEKTLAIHEHRFSNDREDWLKKSGRFNVGVVIGRPKNEFIACINLWRLQVLERCDVVPAEGRCGDQTYLNDWPNLYAGLHVFQAPGVGLGPWNLNNYLVKCEQGKITVDGEPCYFFHFHGLELILKLFGFFFFLPASGYKFTNSPPKKLFTDYLDSIDLFSKKIEVPLNFSYQGSRSMWLLKSFIMRRLNLHFSKIIG